MRITIFFILNFLVTIHSLAYANPYWNPQRVPKDSNYASSRLPLLSTDKLKTVKNENAIDVLRIQVDWQEGEIYQVSHMVIEPSGTQTFLTHSKTKPRWGSYLGVLKDKKTGTKVYYDAIGTGKEYRKLARAINLRFPMPTEEMIFELFAENPRSGQMEKVISTSISPKQLKKITMDVNDVEIKELALAKRFPSIRVNIYAEGYLKNEKEIFWRDAVRAVQVLQKENFPEVDVMSFYGVFHPSNKRLGRALDLGLPVPEYDTFLGLYYPYWDKFGRWYNVVYPTREDKFRRGLAIAPYDYAIVLINSDEYWGVGNYMSHTAIPAANPFYFTYLLLHEFGHYFGLNEEYEGGGPTELEFAVDMREVWSQNMTFLVDKRYESLKWKQFVDKDTSLPTPSSDWKPYPPVYGAYRGGYADSRSSKGYSHKPGFNCVMETYPHFCRICSHAIQEVEHYTLGS